MGSDRGPDRPGRRGTSMLSRCRHRGERCARAEQPLLMEDAMGGQYIDIVARDGGKFSAYLATPEQGSGPGLVLLQEIFGINDHMKSMADRYAEEGYVVLVPDLLWRMRPGVALGDGEADIAQARQYQERFDVEIYIADIDATIEALRKLPQHAGKIGTIGYGMGGTLALLAAARTDVDC